MAKRPYKKDTVTFSKDDQVRSKAEGTQPDYSEPTIIMKSEDEVRRRAGELGPDCGGPTMVIQPRDELKRKAREMLGQQETVPPQKSSSYPESGDYTGAPKIPEPETVSLEEQGIEVEEFKSLDDFFNDADVSGQ